MESSDQRPHCGCKLLDIRCKKCGRSDPTYTPEKLRCIKPDAECSGVPRLYRLDLIEPCAFCELSSSQTIKMGSPRKSRGPSSSKTPVDGNPERGRAKKIRGDATERLDRSKSPREENDPVRKRTPASKANRQTSRDQYTPPGGWGPERQSLTQVGPLHNTGRTGLEAAHPYAPENVDSVFGTSGLGGSAHAGCTAGTEIPYVVVPWDPPSSGLSMDERDPMDIPDPSPAHGGQGGLPSILHPRNTMSMRSAYSDLFLNMENLPLPKDNEIPKTVPYRSMYQLSSGERAHQNPLNAELSQISATLIEPLEWEVWRANPTDPARKDLRYRHARPQRWDWPFPLPYEPFLYYEARQRTLGSARTDIQTMLRRYWWREDYDKSLSHPNGA